ncbi:hypothetical protein AOX55_00005963 (plasmid) [Sinorhizobium fredii CCBAU 25509]|nr:hypothetical protein AOX55_00005963 [Sinorhizobium fredii CCBAU 25509]
MSENSTPVSQGFGLAGGALAMDHDRVAATKRLLMRGSRTIAARQFWME